MSSDRSLERFASLRAAIEGKGDRDSVLEAAGISKAEWIDLQAEWLTKLMDECIAGETALAARYLNALDGESAATPAATTTDPKQPTALPSYLLQRPQSSAVAAPVLGVVASPVAAVGQPFDADATLPIPAPMLAMPALPFAAGAATPQAPQASEAAPEARPPDPGAGETALLPMMELTSLTSGTFRDRLGAVVVPILSLDEYAEVRARLTVFGEDHVPTLARFGVASPEVGDALRARFADYFKRDPAAQARFLGAMQAAIVRVRAERDRDPTR